MVFAGRGRREGLLPLPPRLGLLLSVFPPLYGEDDISLFPPSSVLSAFLPVAPRKVV